MDIYRIAASKRSAKKSIGDFIIIIMFVIVEIVFSIIDKWT